MSDNPSMNGFAEDYEPEPEIVYSPINACGVGTTPDKDMPNANPTLFDGVNVDGNILNEITDKEKDKIYEIFKDLNNPNENIKNPFICKTSAPIRVSLDKDPKYKRGSTSNIDVVVMDDNVVHLSNPDDPMLNYAFGVKPSISHKEYSIINQYDYSVDPDTLNNKRTDGKNPHIDPLPISFLQIKTEQEGINWYRVNYPKIPDDLYPIIARYHWGADIQKKGIRNERKRIKKNLEKRGLKIEHKKVSVVFD